MKSYPSEFHAPWWTRVCSCHWLFRSNVLTEATVTLVLFQPTLIVCFSLKSWSIIVLPRTPEALHNYKISGYVMQGSSINFIFIFLIISQVTYLFFSLICTSKLKHVSHKTSINCGVILKAYMDIYRIFGNIFNVYYLSPLKINWKLGFVLEFYILIFCKIWSFFGILSILGWIFSCMFYIDKHPWKQWKLK